MPDSPAPPVTERPGWLGARATLAVRRSARFALGTVAMFGVVMVVLLFVPKSRGSRNSVASAVQEDTVSLLLHADSLHRAALRADSQHAAAVRGSQDPAGGTAGLTPSQRAKRDSLLFLATELDGLIARAESAPVSASYRALVAAVALHGDTRTPRLMDSLDALEKRLALIPKNAADPVYAALGARMNDVGMAIHAAAVHRRESLARVLAEFNTSSGRSTAPTDTAMTHAARNRTRAAAIAGDSLLFAARGRNETAVRSARSASERENRRVPINALLLAAMVIVVVAGFSYKLFAEVSRPTLATPREAERVAGAPVRAVVREADREPRIGGIDPFRMLYLGLTATGTRARTAVVTGDDRAVVATIAGRLALAAVADERATLVMDADAEGSSVAAYYGQRPEPGLSDALAGTRRLREVTRRIGAGDGLSISVIPGGAIRAAEPDLAARESAHADFVRFRSAFDFCVIVAPSESSLTLACSLVEKPVTLLCVQLGGTGLPRLQAHAARIRDSAAALHGLVVWDAELPHLSSRGELMATATATLGRRPNSEGQ
jgi:hypothetical protein